MKDYNESVLNPVRDAELNEMYETSPLYAESSFTKKWPFVKIVEGKNTESGENTWWLKELVELSLVPSNTPEYDQAVFHHPEPFLVEERWIARELEKTTGEEDNFKFKFPERFEEKEGFKGYIFLR